MRRIVQLVSLVGACFCAAFVSCATAESTTPVASCEPNPCTTLNRTVCTLAASGPECSCDPGFLDDGDGPCRLEECLPACFVGQHCLLGSCVPNECPTPCRAGEICADVATDLCQCGTGPACPDTDDCTEGVCVNECTDGIDNDGDGWIDAADPDCATGGPEKGYGTTQCNDGIDNDGDGWIDFYDPDCSDALDNNESPTT